MREVHFHIFKHAYGKSLIAWDEDGVFVHYFDNSQPLKRLKDSYKARFINNSEEQLSKRTLKLKRKIVDFFDGKKIKFSSDDISLKSFSPFKSKVYIALMATNKGQTCSYKELAELAGSKNATRAVGTCMSSNPMPIIIPCHRVLPQSQKLGFFSSPSGASMKSKLLKLEGAKFKL